MSMEAINPATGKTLQTYPTMKIDEVETIVERSHQAFVNWRRVPFSERSKRMEEAAGILEKRSSEYAELMANEMGKPIVEGQAEAQKCAWVCRFYAENAENFLQEESIQTDASESFVTFQPIGVVLAVMPWNFPFWQVFRFAAPALMAGNAGVLKHASNVPGCALAIEDVFRQAGFPEDLFRTVLIGSGLVDLVIDHPLIRATTLTGSTPAGRAVGSRAGKRLKKSVLELGGSDPYLILEDAHIDRAASVCAASRIINSGQSCIAAKRFIVVESVAEEFIPRFVENMQSFKVGNPLEEETQIGPMARPDLRDELHEQVRKSVQKGAQCLVGGKIPNSAGAFYPATVLNEVKPGMPAYDEELFGPVAAIIVVPDEAEAIRVANDSVFGLGAAVFTEDIARGRRIASEELDAGCCFVNTFVKSDPRLPFGGVKESGYGRELAHYGIKEFLNIKTVYID